MSFDLSLSHHSSLEIQWLDMKGRGQEDQFFAEHGSKPEVQAAFFADGSPEFSPLFERILSHHFPAVNEEALSALFSLLNVERSVDTPGHEAYREKVLNQSGLLEYLGGVLAVEEIAMGSKRYAAGILRLLARDARGKAEIIDLEDFLETCVRLLSVAGAPASAMRREVLNTFVNLGVRPENRSRLAQFPGLIDAVEKILGSHFSSIEEKIYVLGVLRNLAVNHPENRKLLGLNDRVTGNLLCLIGPSFPETSKSSAARVEALMLFLDLSTQVENASRIGSSELLINALGGILDNASASIEEKRRAASLLRNLAVNHPENQKRIGHAASAILGLMSVIKLDSPEASVAREQALAALWSLAGHPENKSWMGKCVPLVDAIVHILNLGSASIEEKRCVAGLFKDLAVNHPENQKLLGLNACVIESLVAVIRLASPETSVVREQALSALQNLASHPENKGRLAKFPGLINELVNILHPASANIDEKVYAIYVLETLIVAHPENRRLLGRNDRVIPALFSLVSLESLEASAVRARIEALETLKMFAINSENQTRLAKFPGFIDVLLDILQRDSTNFEEKETAVQVLYNLTVAHEANQRLLGANNRALQSLVKLLMLDSTEPSAEEVRKYALSALRNITKHPANRGKVQLTVNFIEPTVKSLYAGAPFSSLSVRTQAVRLIRFFMEVHPGNKKYIERDERLILGLIDQLSDNSEAIKIFFILVSSRYQQEIQEKTPLVAYLVAKPEILTRLLDALISVLRSEPKSKKALDDLANVAGILGMLVLDVPEALAYMAMADKSQVAMLAILRLFQPSLTPEHHLLASKLFLALDLGFDRLKAFFVLDGCLPFSKANMASLLVFSLGYRRTDPPHILLPSEAMIAFLVFSLLRETDPEEARSLMKSIKEFAASPAWQPQFQAFPPARFLVSHFADESSTPEKQAFSRALAALEIPPDESLHENRFAFLAKTLFPDCVNQREEESNLTEPTKRFKAEQPAVSAEAVASVPSLTPSPLLCTVMRDAVKMCVAVAPGESHQVIGEYAGMVALFL